MSSIDPEETVIDLVNLDPAASRTVIVQAGAFAEHTIRTVGHDVCQDPSWVGGLYDYGHGQPALTSASVRVDAPWLCVELPRSTCIRMTLQLALHTRPPSYRSPFDTPASEGA